MSIAEATQNFFRFFSDSSAGGLVSGKGKGGRRLSTNELLSEFRNHQTFWRRQPTALISVTVNFTDALRRAFENYYGGDSPDRIWIVFISVPHKDRSIYHHAERLARKIGRNKTAMFKDEFIFEWEIPEKYIVHNVSVQTLRERGLDLERYCGYSNGGTSLLRQKIAEHILGPSNSGYDVGLSLGFMARHFGARASVCDIAHQILSECIRILYIDYEAQYVRVSYWKGHETTLDFEHLCWIDKGINEALVEWWLTDLPYKEHCEWVSGLENEMEREWETFWECMNDDSVSLTLQAREDRIHTKIEIAAIKLGL